MRKILQNVLHSYKNRRDYYKINERDFMEGYVSRVKNSFMKKFILKAVVFLCFLIICGYLAYSMAKAMSAPNIKESIAYSALVQILILPIYLHLILSLIISLTIIWFFQKFLPYKKKIYLNIFLKSLEYLGLGTSLGFIVGIMIVYINLSDRTMSSKLDVVFVVGLFSLVGTFISVPFSLVAVLARSGENLYTPIINLVLAPFVFCISWNIPGYLLKRNLIKEIYSQSVEYFAPKYIDRLSELADINPTSEEKKQAIDYVCSESQSTSVLGFQNFILWFILIVALVVFLLSSRSIIREEWRNWKGEIENKCLDWSFRNYGLNMLNIGWNNSPRKSKNPEDSAEGNSVDIEADAGSNSKLSQEVSED